MLGILRGCYGSFFSNIRAKGIFQAPDPVPETCQELQSRRIWAGTPQLCVGIKALLSGLNSEETISSVPNKKAIFKAFWFFYVGTKCPQKPFESGAWRTERHSGKSDRRGFACAGVEFPFPHPPARPPTAAGLDFPCSHQKNPNKPPKK